jgi:hypothetical protein
MKCEVQEVGSWGGVFFVFCAMILVIVIVQMRMPRFVQKQTYESQFTSRTPQHFCSQLRKVTNNVAA